MAVRPFKPFWLKLFHSIPLLVCGLAATAIRTVAIGLVAARAFVRVLRLRVLVQHGVAGLQAHSSGGATTLVSVLVRGCLPIQLERFRSVSPTSLIAIVKAFPP